jgi:enamine deaminase RidA (YjgF/YER057c/UK114 family)
MWPPACGRTERPNDKCLHVSDQSGFVALRGPDKRASIVLLDIKVILERHGSSLQNVVKCTVFLADIKEWPAFNEVYREFFKTNLPARSALGANGLAIGARVEVDCVAGVPAKK